MMKKKFKLYLIALCLLSSLFFSHIVCGADYYRYIDDFSSYTQNTYTGFNVNMQNNWRTANNNEVKESYSTLPIGYGNGSLKINTKTDTVGIKYTTLNANKFPTAVFTADHSGLSSSQRIRVKATKSHGSDMWGVRFYVHNGTDNKLNYYTLFFGGMYTRGYSTTQVAETGYLTWGLYKCTNDTVVTLEEQTRNSIGNENDVNGYMGVGTASLEIEIADNEIIWSLDYVNGSTTYSYSDSYVDENMFDVDGTDTTVHFYAAGSTNSSRYIYFDDFSIENDWDVPEYSNFNSTGSGTEVFSDNFDSYASDWTKTGNSIELGGGWVSKSADIGPMGTNNSAVFGFSDGKLKIGTFTNTHDKFINDIMANEVGVVHSVPDGMSENHVIKVSGTKSHESDVWGVKFLVHNSGRSYYVFLVSGKYTRGENSYFSDYGIYKYDNGVKTVIYEQAGTGQQPNMQGGYASSGGTTSLEISYLNGDISYDFVHIVDGQERIVYNGCVTDQAPFNLENEDLSVELFAAGSTNSSRAVLFDDFSLEKRVFEELDNAVFLNCAEGISPDNKGIIDLGAGYVINEIYCDGEELPELVLVSKNKVNWYKLADSDDFEENEFFNNVTTQDFRYIYAGGAIENLKFLYTTDCIDCDFTEYVTIYPRVYGENYYSYIQYGVTVDDSSVAYIDGNKVRANDVGTVKVSAGTGKKKAVLEINFYSKNAEYTEPDFVIYRNVLSDAKESNNIYTLKGKERIFRLVASNVIGELKVYASEDNEKWFKIADFQSAGEWLNSKFTAEFNYIKTSGNGNIEALGQLDGKNVHALPGMYFNIYTYNNGQRVNPSITYNNSYVLSNNGRIMLLRNLKEIPVSVSYSGNANSFLIDSRPVDVNYNVEFDGNNAVLTLSEDRLHNENAILQIIKYNTDGSLNSVTFNNIAFTNGEATVSINDINRIGTYTVIRVVNGELIPFTNRITIN